jgi:hypothetical protein
MSAFIKLYCLSLCLVGTFALNEDVFKITALSFSDTVTVSKYTTDGVAVPIEWTVPDALADKPVMVSLVQGNALSLFFGQNRSDQWCVFTCIPSKLCDEVLSNGVQRARQTMAHTHGAATSLTARSFLNTAMARFRAVITRLS